MDEIKKIPEKNTRTVMNGKTGKVIRLRQKNARLKKACRKARCNGKIYSHIAFSLARGCIDLFFVNVDTGNYIEYRTDDEHGELREARRASDFFISCERESKLYVHPEDREAFISAMNQKFIREALSRSREFRMIYRRIKDGRTFYVLMKVSYMEDDNRYIVIGVFDIDELETRRRAEKRIEEERTVYARLHAITGNFIVVYVVDPETDKYREFNSTEEYVNSLGLAKEGDDFFGMVRETAPRYNHPEDVKYFLSAFTKENIMAEIKNSGMSTLGFRLMLGGQPRYVQMKASLVEEKEGHRLIVGLNDIDAQVRQEEKIKMSLAQAQSRASIDPLTGIKNKHAYQEAENRLDLQISEHSARQFAILVMDMNDLKKINDTMGHQAGDQFIRDACRIICNVFKHSPVFRIGGDEFAVIAQGDDYLCLEDRLAQMEAHNTNAMVSGGIVIACGMSKFENDTCAAVVFERADRDMYENKKRLKSLSGPSDSGAG